MLVAPDERREKVFGEVNRPTFSRLSPKLADICRFISFHTLREKLKQVGSPRAKKNAQGSGRAAAASLD
jgi:hypothetical protein